MNELIYKNELFSGQEMMVLAAYSGMEKLRILSERNIEKLEAEQLNAVVFRLYQKGLLCWNGENGYCMQPEIRELFQSIKYACRELEIHVKGQKSPIHCFLNEDVVIMEISQNDENRVKVHRVTQEEFLAELYDREILPLCAKEKKEIYEETEDGRLLWMDFQKENPGFERQLEKTLERASTLHAYVRIYDRAAEQEQAVALVLTDHRCGCVTIIRQGAVQTKALSERCIRELLAVQAAERKENR